MRCAIYARVSTRLDSQKDSLESQVSFFENHILEKGWKQTGVYVDEGITGTSTAGRKDLKRLLRDAERELFDIVLIKSLSRLSRDTSDSLSIVRTLHRHNVDVFSSREGMLDDEMVLSVLSAVNQRQSEDTSYNVSWGIAVKSNAGIFHGTPPFGYDKVKPGRLVPNLDSGGTVKLIFDLYLNKGLGVQAIANYLNEKGIRPSRRKSQKWYDSSVRLILKNRHYTGDLVQGRTKVDSKDKIHLQEKGYKKRQKIDESDWIVKLNKHEPLITREQFEAVQEKMSERAKRIFSGKGKKSLFARLAFCDDCGKGMNYRNDRGGYVCSTYQKEGSKKCASHFIPHVYLKEAVIEDLRSLSDNTLDCNPLVAAALKKANLHMTHAKDELDKISKEISLLKEEQVELVHLLTRKTIKLELFEYSNSIIDSKIQTLKGKSKELESILSQEQESEEALHAFQKDVEQFVKLEIKDEEILRDMLHRLVDRVEIAEDGSITIHYNFKNPLLMGI